MGLLVASAVSIRVLAQADWNPTIFTAFGEEAVSINEYAEGLLGQDVWLRRAAGHDGKFFFIQANDPWVIDPAGNASFLDRPLYRSQRMLYPVLAGLGGILPATGVVWGLIVVNVLALGFGSWAVGRLAQVMGASAWWGLSFVLNLGFVSELTIDGAGIVAGALVFLAVLLLLEGRVAGGVVALSGAVLAREVMLIAAVGAAFWLLRRKRVRAALWTLSAPLVSVGLWAVYLRARLPRVEPTGWPIWDWPLMGVVKSLDYWSANPLDLVVGVAMLLLLVLFTRRALTSDHLVGWAVLGFVPMALILSRYVWSSWFDVSRAVAPLLTAMALLVMAGRSTQAAEVGGRQPITASRG